MTVSDKTLVVHLSSDDQIKAGKAIRFASQALSFADKTVMLFTAQGVNVVNRSSGGFTIPGTEVNSLDAIREFLKDGGHIFIGKDCMKLQNISAGDIIAGCEQAEPKTTFGILLGEDSKVMSW